MPHLFRLNVNVAGVGYAGEEVTGDPVLWAEWIEAGFFTDLGSTEPEWAGWSRLEADVPDEA